MQHDKVTILENGITFDISPRATLGGDKIVAILVDGNSERHKIEIYGSHLPNVIDQLMQRIKVENIPFLNRAHLYINPSNPIYLLRASKPFFAPPTTVSAAMSHTAYPPFV